MSPPVDLTLSNDTAVLVLFAVLAQEHAPRSPSDGVAKLNHEHPKCQEQ